MRTDIIREDINGMRQSYLNCRKYIDGLPESDIKADLDLLVSLGEESINELTSKVCP